MRSAAAPGGLALVGAAVALLAGGSTAGVAVAMALIGCAAVVAVALVFLAVGRAEDRDRAQASPAPEDPPPRAPEHPRTLGLGPDRRPQRPPRRPH